MKIIKDKDNLIISVPLKTERSNPWDESYHPEMDNVVGVIAGDEIGFAYYIDMDYKGKDDQISVPFLLFDGEEKEFKKLCKELEIELVIYPLCNYCRKAIYGTYTLKNKGNMCYSCELERK